MTSHYSHVLWMLSWKRGGAGGVAVTIKEKKTTQIVGHWGRAGLFNYYRTFIIY